MAVDRPAEPSQRARTCRFGKCNRFVSLSCSGGPGVAVVQAAELWDGDDCATVGRLNYAWRRRVSIEREVRSRFVIVREVVRQDPP